MNTIRITLSPAAYMPTRGSDGSSGYDLYSPSDVVIRPGQVVVIHSGVSLELPDGWEGQIRPRSSMSQRGVWGALGTIDSDYRGVVGGTLVNLGQRDVIVFRGERFAQLVFARIEHAVFDVATELSTTARGAGGFGSTGR